MDRIIFEEENVSTIINPEHIFYGLTFMETKFGPISTPQIVKKVDELKEKYGLYLDEDEVEIGHPGTLNEWMQAWNYLQYTSNLYMYRIGSREIEAVFDGSGDLVSVSGSMNGHSFINNKSSSMGANYWNSSNGVIPLVKLNEFQELNDITFTSEQLFYLMMKYPGNTDEYSFSVFNSDSDIDKTYIYNWNKYTTTSPTVFTLDEEITTTEGFRGTVRKIDGNNVFYESTSKILLEVGNNVTNGLVSETVVSLTSGDVADDNYTLSSIFDRECEDYEFYFILSKNNKIIFSKIFSLDQSKKNSLYDFQHEMFEFRIPNEYILPSDAVDPDDSIVHEVINRTLSFGKCDTPSEESYLKQLDEIPKNWFPSGALIFFVDKSSIIQAKMYEIAETSSIKILIN